MPLALRLQDLGIDPGTVIAHQKSKLARRIFEFDFDARGARVAKCND
jgi:hypothetical protein